MIEAKFKKQYDKPSMKVHELKPFRLICGSGDPNWYNQPGGPGQF